MAGRALTSTLLFLVLSVSSSAARAEDQTIAVGEPSPQTQAQPPELPKLLGFGKGEDGTHAFLFGRKDGPATAFIGQPGALKELDILGMERYPGKFVLDTLQLGTIEFHTTDRSVIIPGDVGFNAKRPTRVMSQTPDKAVFVEALGRMGFAVPSAPLALTTGKSTTARVLTRGLSTVRSKNGDRLRSFNRRLRARAALRRPTAKRQPVRSRQAARAAAH